MFALLALGAAAGAAIGYLYARGRLSSMTADLTGQARAAEERARAAQDRAAILERAAQERAALIDGQMAERFQAMSAQALDRSAKMFLEIAEGRSARPMPAPPASWRTAGPRSSTWFSLCGTRWPRSRPSCGRPRKRGTCPMRP